MDKFEMYLVDDDPHYIHDWERSTGLKWNDLKDEIISLAEHRKECPMDH